MRSRLFFPVTWGLPLLLFSLFGIFSPAGFFPLAVVSCILMFSSFFFLYSAVGFSAIRCTTGTLVYFKAFRNAGIHLLMSFMIVLPWSTGGDLHGFFGTIYPAFAIWFSIFLFLTVCIMPAFSEYTHEAGGVKMILLVFKAVFDRPLLCSYAGLILFGELLLSTLTFFFYPAPLKAYKRLTDRLFRYGVLHRPCVHHLSTQSPRNI